MDWIIRQSPFTHAAWALLVATAIEQFAVGHGGWGWVALSGAGAILMWVLFERYLGLAAPRSFIAGFAIFVVATLLLGEIRLFYARFPLWDYTMHTVAGIAFAAFGALPARALKVPPVLLFAFLFGTTCGVVWEIFEYAVDTTFGIDTQTDLTDTMHDLICNTAGSAVGAWLGARWAAGRSTGPPGECLDDFVGANARLFGGCGEAGRSGTYRRRTVGKALPPADAAGDDAPRP